MDYTYLDYFNYYLKEFLNEIVSKFPDFKHNVVQNYRSFLEGKDSKNDMYVKYFYTKINNHLISIAKKDESIFSTPGLVFIEGVDFHNLWNSRLNNTENKAAIWKYLQLILFSIVSGISDTSSFGDTAKLFEAIGEEEFKTKLEETITQMEGMFNKTTSSDDSDSNTSSTFNAEDLPNAQDIHEHVLGMMGGKLGTLAREIAEETARDMQVDLENITTANDVFKQLFKNPASLMKLVKTVGSKLDDRLQSGDIKESELLEEAQDMMKKMKNMPGMGNLQGLLGKMGMGGGGKMNTGAMQAQLSQRMRMAQTKERMRSRVQSRQEKDEMTTMSHEEFKKAEERAQQMARDLIAEEEGNTTHVFKSGDGAIRSTRADKPETKSSKNKKNKKKKKGKERK